MQVICDRLLPRAEALNLSENFIGQRGIRSFEISLRKIALSPLLELNLQAPLQLPYSLWKPFHIYFMLFWMKKMMFFL